MHSYKWNSMPYLILGSVVLSIWAMMLHGTWVMADDETISMDQGQVVTLNSLVMEIHPRQSMMIVGEKRIYISKSIAGKIFKTELQDQHDSEMALTDFAEGDRVLIKGFKLSDGAILAQLVKKMPNYSSDGKK